MRILGIILAVTMVLGQYTKVTQAPLIDDDAGDDHIPIVVHEVYPTGGLMKTSGGSPAFVHMKFSFGGNKAWVDLKAKPLKVSGVEFYWKYKGSGEMNGVKIDYITFVFPRKNLESFEGSFAVEGHVYKILPGHRVKGFEKSPAVVLEHRNYYEPNSSPAERRQLYDFNGQKFSGCWTGQESSIKELEVGYIVDPPYVAKTLELRAGDPGSNKDKVALEIVNTNTIMNGMYNYQMSVSLKMAKIVDQEGLFPEQMASSFSLGCGRDISTYLQSLAQWRNSNKGTEYGIWKLMTDCYPPPGTIGIAYVGTLCRGYGVGVTTYTQESSYGGTWKTLAHEIGHIFGARHSFENGQGQTGGIMDYGPGTIDGAFQFNQMRKEEVCGTIRNTLASSRIPNCWKTLQPEPGTTTTTKDPTPAPTTTTTGVPASTTTLDPTPKPTPQPSTSPTPQPTTSPSPRPTPAPTESPTFSPLTSRPTKRPTSTTSAPVNTDEPTNYPTTSDPSNNPTFRPTSPTTTLSPAIFVTDDNNEYKWVASGYTDCSPDEGFFRMQSTAYVCRVNGEGANVDEELCDPGNKPIHSSSHRVYYCSNVAFTGSCGDGILDPGEDCEPSDGDVCCTSTCTFSNAASCRPKNYQVDASYMDRAGHLFLFQGKYVYKFASMAAETPMGGWPRLINTVYPGLVWTPGYQQDIGAALMRSGDTLLYLFKGLDFVIYDTENDVVRVQSSLANTVSYTFGQCGSIDAALAFQAEMFIFCQSVYNIIPYGGTWSHFRTVADLDIEWPDAVNTYISAAVHDSRTGMSRFWNANQVVQWTGRRMDEGYPLERAGLGEGVTTTEINCQENCAECTSPTICTKCEDTHKLFFRRCWPKFIFGLLEFNVHQETEELSDENYIEGGKKTLEQFEQDGKLVPGLVSGGSTDDGLALAFDGQTKVPMMPLHTTWETIKITAYFKPNDEGAALQRFITFTDGEDEKIIVSFGSKRQCQPPSGCNCKEVHHPDHGTIASNCGYHFGADSQTASSFPFCYVDGNCTGIEETVFRTPTQNITQTWAACTDFECSDWSGESAGDQFEIDIVMPSGIRYACFVEEPLQARQWNKILFEISDTMLKTGVNGVFHHRGFEEIGTTQSDFALKHWYLGHEETGIEGTLDHFQLIIEGGESTLTEDDDDIMSWLLPLIIVLSVCCVAVLAGFGWKYYQDNQEYKPEYQDNQDNENNISQMTQMTNSASPPVRQPPPPAMPQKRVAGNNYGGGNFGVNPPRPPPGRPAQGMHMAPPIHRGRGDSDVGIYNEIRF